MASDPPPLPNTIVPRISVENSGFAQVPPPLSHHWLFMAINNVSVLYPALSEFN